MNQDTEYTRAQFEGAYRSLVQMIHAVGYIDINEVQRWVLKITDEDPEREGAELTESQLAGRNRVMQMFDNLAAFKETLKQTGVPPIPPVVTGAPKGN
jgi:hypothetical protein